MLLSVSFTSTISSSPFFFTAWAFSLAMTEGVIVLVSATDSAKAFSASMVVNPEAASTAFC